MGCQTKNKVQAVEGIRDYDRVRRFLRNIHLYGFFSREDFKKAGIASTGDYNAMGALIREVLPEIEDAALWREHRKYPRIRREYARSGESALSNSYMLHAMDEEAELPMLLRLLSALSRERLSLREAAEEIEFSGESGDTSKYSTVRRKIADLMEYGVTEERNKTFGMKKDVLSRLGIRELLQLRTYAYFAGGVTYPRVAASFLVRAVDRELIRRGVNVKKEMPILLRHGVSNGVFDEEIVYMLLSAIRKKESVLLSVEQRGEKKLREIECLPLALRVDCRLGRWYLIGKERRLVIRRISRIRKVKPGRPADEAAWQEDACAAQEYYGNTGVSGAMPYGHPVLVEAKLRFGSSWGMRKQFMREMRLGHIVEKEDGEYYRALVNDPVETLPLLRAYAPWLQVQQGEHDLDIRLREGLIRMRDMLKEGDGNEAAE